MMRKILCVIRSSLNIGAILSTVLCRETTTVVEDG